MPPLSIGRFHLHKSILEERHVVTTLEGHFQVPRITHMDIKVKEKPRYISPFHVKPVSQEDWNVIPTGFKMYVFYTN